MKIAVKYGLNLVTENDIFIFNNKIYMQTKGGSMGFSIASSLTEFKLRPLEKRDFKRQCFNSNQCVTVMRTTFS